MLTRIFSLILALVVLAVPLGAQQPTTASIYTAFSDESLTVDATAGGVPFTAATYNAQAPFGRSVAMATFRVVCSASSPCSINVLYDGNAPTSSTGFPLDVGDIGTIYGQANIQKFRAIRSGANSAVLRVVYHY